MARRKKLSKSEKIERDIRLNLRKQERSVEMSAKAAKMLKASALALARLHRQKERLEAKTANELVKTQVESPPPVETPPKPKRQRKPKATDGATPDFVQRQKDRAAEAEKSVEERHQRMEAMGFRKTSKRKAVAPSAESK